MSQLYPAAFEETGRSVLEEGNIGRIIAGYASNHLIRQYGGNRIGDCFSEMEDVVKIFLEFCPGGSLDQLLPQPGQKTQPPLHEADMWQIFNCLAMGVYAMERESEDMPVPGAPVYNGLDTELLHCDMKPDNVFFGYKDDDHRRMPISKIADFGEALFIESSDLQDDADGARYLERGAPAYKPPEEVINKLFNAWKDSGIPLNHPRKGTCSNIWQVGAIMNSIILRGHINFNPDVVKGVNPPLVNRSKLESPSTLRNINLSSQLNHSQGLEDKTITNLYSAALLTLVQECLFREPEFRPTADVLVEYTNFGLQTAMVKLKKTRPFPLLPHPFRNMKFNDANGPVEPPTAWLVNHVQDENGGGYYDARDEPPPKRSMLSTAMGVVSPIVTRSVRSSLSSGTSIFSSLVGSTITRATTSNQSSNSGGASRPVSRPTSPPTPGLGIARKMAGGMMGFTGIGARFVFNTAKNQVSGRKTSLTSANSVEEAQADDEFVIVEPQAA
ncbi:kinase-like protein [Acephala macrosclerotiorum]|nr:kinase-like protein [Acephala macrosclerotiorum]